MNFCSMQTVHTSIYEYRLKWLCVYNMYVDSYRSRWPFNVFSIHIILIPPAHLYPNPQHTDFQEV